MRCSPSGPVAAEVLPARHETGADLLVLGRRGRGGLAKLALGCSTLALPLVVALCNRGEARLLVLHMISPIPPTSASLCAYHPAMPAGDQLQKWAVLSGQSSLEKLRAWTGKKSTPHPEPEYIVRTDSSPEGIFNSCEHGEGGSDRAGSKPGCVAKAGCTPPLDCHPRGDRVRTVPRLATCGMRKRRRRNRSERVRTAAAGQSRYDCTIFSSAGRLRMSSVDPFSCSSCFFLNSENNRLTVSRVVPIISAISS
jgi:hypothetical protein